jgi:S1-C subfamily serine protease
MNKEHLQKLQADEINIARSIISKKLSSTDWYVTRNVERGIEIPADVAAERATAIEKFNAFETAILGATTENINNIINEFYGNKNKGTNPYIAE